MNEQERPKSDQPAEVLLRWIADDMKIVRQTLVKISFYIAEAESEVPEKVRRFMNYMHDVHDVKYMYEELGHPVPQHLLRELERLDDRYRQILKTLYTDAGAFEKIRREMSEDKDNVWDHTRQLDFKGRSGKT
jgi:hypothetical protein